MLVLLLLLIVGGVGAWIVVFQPFTIPAITQPQQSFKDTNLGLSLLYPSGWMVQVDHNTATVHFSDSSHTAQFNIVIAAANGTDASQSLQKEATQLGMTGLKPGEPVSFAGVSWQQLQGSVQQNGANYTEMLLATVHGDRLITIMQLAPQATYTDEEQIVFSGMRSSFQFLS